MTVLENQNIEWKETWRDEYINCICGFANAQGGILEIGRNNNGEVIGLSNASKLLEELPNKIRNATGVLADVIATSQTVSYQIMCLQLNILRIEIVYVK